MLGNIIDTNQYFESLVLNDKRREQLFADMMNTLYKAQGESILNAAGSRSEAKKIYRLVNHLEEQSDNVRESIALLTMIKAKAAAKQGERILLSKTQLLSLMDTVILREWAIIVIPAKRE